MKENLEYRKTLKDRKRVVVKIGSSSLLHESTRELNYRRIDYLARELTDLKNGGRDVILVSSGATAVGRSVMHVGKEIMEADGPITVKQACAAVGQARLMMTYQKLFEEYNQITAQVLMTRNTVTDALSKYNLVNTFTELLKLGVIPIVNENDSVATYEYSLGDNDTLSAIVSSIMGADLLILLSDVDGLYTDDPRENKVVGFIEYVEKIDDSLLKMGKKVAGSEVGTGGMSSKLTAARIATYSGCDMVIVNSRDLHVIEKVINGENVGTLFRSDPRKDYDILDYLEESE